jgi:hypothetical protein
MSFTITLLILSRFRYNRCYEKCAHLLLLDAIMVLLVFVGNVSFILIGFTSLFR